MLSPARARIRRSGRHGTNPLAQTPWVRRGVIGGWRNKVRSALAGLFLVAVLSRLSPAAESAWPPVTGELGGDFAFSLDPSALKLRWEITARPGETPGQREIVFSVSGRDAKVRGACRVDEQGGVLWRLDELELDLAVWHQVLAARWPVLGPGLALGGVLRASGEGTWRDQQIGGRATLAWRGGSVDDPAHKFSLSGITLDLACEDLFARRTSPGQLLAWAAGKFDVIAVGAGQIGFAVDGTILRIERAAVGVLGGELLTGAFSFPIEKPEFLVRTEVHGLELAQLLPFLPPVAAEASGQLDGELTLRRRETGLEIGVGRLAVRSGQSAQVRLLPTPGLLSSSLPDSVKKHYPGLGDLEEGRMPIKADILEVTFSPAGDAEGRTASIRLAGGPVDPRLQAPVDLKVNVRGPLEMLVKFGTDSRLRLR